MRTLYGASKISSLLLVLFVTLSYAIAQSESRWPVTVAADGFSTKEVARVRDVFSPLKLASGGNQALYTYLNMAEFFPHQVVPRSGAIKSLPYSPEPRFAQIRAQSDMGQLTLAEIIKHPKSRVQGFIILHKGNIVYEEYPGMQADDSHLWWSVAKVLGGVLTEQLIHEGKIDRNRNIVYYLPEFNDSGWDGASVDNVLNMASGIKALDSPQAYGNPLSEMGKLIYAEGILALPTYQPVTHNEALQNMTSANIPGTKYAYSSANTNMLGLLIERVTGRRYVDVVRDRIWSHIGAEGDALLGVTQQGNAIAHGMFSSRLRDLARFGMLFTPSGFNPKVVSKSVLERMRSRNNNSYYSNSPGAATDMEKRLGDAPVNALAQWDALLDDGDLFKSGFDGQALYVSPKKDLVIAMFSTSKNKSVYRYLRSIAVRLKTIEK